MEHGWSCRAIGRVAEGREKGGQAQPTVRPRRCAPSPEAMRRDPGGGGNGFGQHLLGEASEMLSGQSDRVVRVRPDGLPHQEP